MRARSEQPRNGNSRRWKKPMGVLSLRQGPCRIVPHGLFSKAVARLAGLPPPLLEELKWK